MKHFGDEKKVLPLIFVIDSSGGASGELIASVNEGMKSLISNMKRNIEEYSIRHDCQIRLAILTYSSEVRWITRNGLEKLDDLEWCDFSASGLSNLGVALSELGSKLSKRELFYLTEKYMIPAIVYIVEGSPTDDYLKELNNLSENNRWFKIAHKVCIGFNYPDEQMIGSLSDNEKYSLIADSPDELKDIIGNQLFEILSDFMDTRDRIDEDAGKKENHDAYEEVYGDDWEDDMWI